MLLEWAHLIKLFEELIELFAEECVFGDERVALIGFTIVIIWEHHARKSSDTVLKLPQLLWELICHFLWKTPTAKVMFHTNVQMINDDNAGKHTIDIPRYMIVLLTAVVQDEQ